MSGPIIISIEGNIGAGKTTALEKLQERMQGDNSVVFLREPVDIWETFRDSNTGETILEKFYKDTSKYAFSFQIMACATRLSSLRRIINENPQCKVVVCERSLDADKHIFAKMLCDDGQIENVHMQIYQHFYDEFVKEFRLDGLVFIDANPFVCFDRIDKRGRKGENQIAFDYLVKCDKYHRDWAINLKARSSSVLSIDANESATYDVLDPTDLGQQWLDQIVGFIENLRVTTHTKERALEIV